jgi:hypothetical protein
MLKNSPTFIADTARHYLFIQEVGDQVPAYLKHGEAAFRQLLTDFLTGKGTLEQDDWAWEDLLTFIKTAPAAGRARQSRRSAGLAGERRGLM